MHGELERRLKEVQNPGMTPFRSERPTSVSKSQYWLGKRCQWLMIERRRTIEGSVYSMVDGICCRLRNHASAHTRATARCTEGRQLTLRGSQDVRTGGTVRDCAQSQYPCTCAAAAAMMPCHTNSCHGVP